MPSVKKVVALSNNTRGRCQRFDSPTRVRVNLATGPPFFSNQLAADHGPIITMHFFAVSAELFEYCGPGVLRLTKSFALLFES